MKRSIIIAAVIALGLLGSASAQTKRQIEREAIEHFAEPCITISLFLEGYSMEEAKSIARDPDRWASWRRDIIRDLVNQSIQMNITAFSFNERMSFYMTALGNCLTTELDYLD